MGAQHSMLGALWFRWDDLTRKASWVQSVSLQGPLPASPLVISISACVLTVAFSEHSHEADPAAQFF